MVLRNNILFHKDSERILFVRIMYQCICIIMYVAVVDIIENTVKYIYKYIHIHICVHTYEHVVCVCVCTR